MEVISLKTLKKLIFWLEFYGYLLGTLIIGLYLYFARIAVFCGKRVLYLILEGILWLVAKILFRFNVRGRGNIPQDSNFIVVARHRSFWDIPLMAVSPGFKHQITFVARRTLRWFWFAPFIRFYTIPISRGQEFSLSNYRAIVKPLREGEIVGIFPEGTRNPETKKINSGFIHFAQRTETPILPLKIDADGPYGKREDKPDGSGWRYIKGETRIKLKIGSPIEIKEKLDSKKARRKACQIIEDLDQI